MKGLLAILPLMLAAPWSVAQFDEQFLDENLRQNPAWHGTLQLFSNIDDRIRLDDPSYSGNGMAWLGYYAPMQSDQTRYWRFTLGIDYAPSPSNHLRVYLQGDQPDPARMTRAYLLQVGGISGDEDGLVLYYLESGAAQTILRGTPGQVADPMPSLGITLLQHGDGSWELWTRPVPDQAWTLEAGRSGPAPRLDGPYWTAEYRYTPSRARSSSLDSLSFGPLADSPAPTQVRYVPLGVDEHYLLFDHPIGRTPAPEQFDLAPYGRRPAAIARLDTDPRILRLQWDPPLLDGRPYQLRIAALAGLGTGISPPLDVSFTHYIPVDPFPGGLCINELLFDPPPFGHDYLEVFNASRRAIRLQGLQLQNGSGQAVAPDFGQGSLLPGHFLVLCPEESWLRGSYSVPGGVVHESALPPLPDRSGTIALYYRTQEIDRLAYRADMHSPWLRTTEGIALERIDPDGPSGDDSNWHSAASSAGFGTPGRPNSQYHPLGGATDLLHLPDRAFSPDGDGHTDFLIIQYRAPEPNSTYSLRIFDERGRPVHTLARNELAGNAGTLRWDGRTDEGRRAALGIYLLIMEWATASGRSFRLKDYCVLSGGRP